MARATEHGRPILAPPRDFVVAARATMGGVDLAPWTTADNNRLIESAHIYDGEHLDFTDLLSRPWEAPRSKRILLYPYLSVQDCRRLINKTLREYRQGSISQACVCLPQNESILKLPWIWDFPVCIPFKRLRPSYWDDELERFVSVSPANWSLIFYLPPCQTPDDYLHSTVRFHRAFAGMGRIIVNENAGEDDWAEAYHNAIGTPYSYR